MAAAPQQEFQFQHQGPLQYHGEGMYGQVYKGQDKITGKTYALKKLKISAADDGIPGHVVRELGLLQELNHRNVVKFVSVQFHGTTRLYLVMEFVEHNLEEVMTTYRHMKQHVPLPRVLDFAKQLLDAVQHCHAHKVLHRDIKPANILITADGIVKLCDFGISRSCQYPARPLTNPRYSMYVVTMWYRAPELLLGMMGGEETWRNVCGERANYGGCVDVWSVGCVVSELMMMRVLFHGDSEFGQLMQIFRFRGTPGPGQHEALTKCQYYRPCFPKWAPAPLGRIHSMPEDAPIINLLDQLLCVDPTHRITARCAARHSALERTEPFVVPMATVPGQAQPQQPSHGHPQAAQPQEPQQPNVLKAPQHPRCPPKAPASDAPTADEGAVQDAAAEQPGGAPAVKVSPSHVDGVACEPPAAAAAAAAPAAVPAAEE